MAESSIVEFATTSASIRIPFDRWGCLAGAKAKIPLRIFTDNLRTTNESSGDLAGKFYWADFKKHVLHLPIYLRTEFLKLLTSYGQDYKEYVLDPGDGAPAIFKTTHPNKNGPFVPKDERQARAIEYATNPLSGPIRPIAIQTGGGKTATAIQTTHLLKERAMVVSPLNLHQWASAIQDFSDVPAEKIFTIRGSASVRYLIEEIEDINPPFILASTQTLDSLMKKDLTAESPLGEEQTFNGLLQLLNVGLFFIDETHLFFERNVELLLRLNPKIAIPMTATFTNRDRHTKTILNNIFPPDKRFGESEYKKYVHIVAIRYSFGKMLHKRLYHRKAGYNHNTLEKSLLFKKTKLLKFWFSEIFIPVLNRYYLDVYQDADKCLVLCSGIKFCEQMKMFVEKYFEEKNIQRRVVTMVGGVPRQKVLEADVVIATAKSGGTGSDLPNVLTMINTVAVDSETENMQNLGRLRELKDKRNPYYVFLTWDDIPPHRRYLATRSRLYAPAGLSYNVLRITPDPSIIPLY